jgi:hypothetical protein
MLRHHIGIDEDSFVNIKSRPVAQRKAKKQPELSFITTTQAEVKDEKTRKLVRSHVMRRHHAHLRRVNGYASRKEVRLMQMDPHAVHLRWRTGTA